MSIPHRVRGVKILKAVSSPLRLQILNLLFDKGPLSYTELMSSLKMNPSRDAGRFAYHLKFLLKADLIEADVEAKKYCLTDMGKMVIDVAEKIEKKAFRPKGMLIRTSRFALEEFDANKIANSLIREAKMPAELAQKVAKEAEKQLLKSKTKYLSAPLVREVVNAILIDKGLEEYRHKLTRLGLPVHDVATLMETKSKISRMSASIQETAGAMIFKEYTLLNTLPRDIADAHLSGSIHIDDLGSWILKPSEIVHDLRFFLQNGLNLEKISAHLPSYPSPSDFETALAMILNVALHSAKEASATQIFEYFNVFVAPFVKGMTNAEIKENLRVLVSNLNQHANTSLNLELTVPDFMAEKPAVGPSGKVIGKYADFVAESQLLAALLLEIFAEGSARKPLSNPKMIFKIRSTTFADEKAKTILLSTLRLASEKGIVYFANVSEKERRFSVFSPSGFKFAADVNGDWEIDTLRTGCLGRVTVNLPRIAYESEKDKGKFVTLLKERLEMAARALEIKYRVLKQHGEGLLPFLLQTVNGDKYFRLEDSMQIVNLVGLEETAEVFCGKTFYEDEKTFKFIEETAQTIADFMHKIGRRRGRRLFPAIMPDFESCERLVRLDMERYGVAKIKFSGTREKPSYSTISSLTLQEGKISSDHLTAANKLSSLCVGGSLAVIDLGTDEHKPEELMLVTEQIAKSHAIGLFTYDRKLTYCSNCKRSWLGPLHKCPSCGGVGTLTVFHRSASA